MKSPHKTIIALLIGALFMLAPAAFLAVKARQASKALDNLSLELQTSMDELVESTNQLKRELKKAREQADELDRLVGELGKNPKEPTP